MSSLSKPLKAYIGWFLALIGGFAIGFGAGVLMIMRMLVERWDYAGDLSLLSDFLIICMILVLLGVVAGGIGLYAIHSSLKTESPKPSLPSLEKKFCRYCGTENKSDAVFCEKCRKKLD